jgi:hypothetical protein
MSLANDRSKYLSLFAIFKTLLPRRLRYVTIQEPRYTAQKANTTRSLAPNWIKLEQGRDMTHNNNNAIDSEIIVYKQLVSRF